MSALRRVATNCTRALRPAVPGVTGAARFASDWLQSKPPTVNLEAGTVAAWYYKNIRGFDTPTKDAVVAPSQDIKLNVGDFDKHVYAYACGFLDALDIQRGDKVVVYAGNELENLVIQFASALAGATVVVVDPTVDASSLVSIIATENAKALFFSPRFNGEARVGKIQEAFREELEPFTFGGRVGYEPIASKRMLSLRWIVQTGFDPIEGIVRLKDLPVYGEDGSYAHDEVAVAQHRVSAADVATSYYAAGADGRVTKAATTSQADTISKAAAAAKALKLTSKDVVTITAPVYHPLGFAAGALAAATTHAKAVYPSKTFDAAKSLQAITAHRSTVLVASQEQVGALNSELQADAAKPEGKRSYDVSSLRSGLVSGAQNAKIGTLTLASFA